jgi:hypothetical protein
MSERPPTTLFIHSVQSHGHYSHFTLLTTLHRSYHMATCVPCGQASVCHASPIFGPSRPLLLSLSHLLNDDLHLPERLTPPFRSWVRRPVSNHQVRRFVLESMHAEVRFRPMSFQIRQSSICVVMPGGIQHEASDPCPQHRAFSSATTSRCSTCIT